MKFNVIPSSKFKKQAKRLSKKYPSLKEELSEIGDILANKPETGTSLGNDLYKIRLAIRSKGKGKSGGGRIITYIVNENQEIYLLVLYDKSEFDTIDDRILKNIINSLSLGDN